MPLATSGNGYNSTNKTLAQLCPTLQVGDTAWLYFDKNTGAYNYYIYLENYTEATWVRNQSRTITQNDLDSTVILYGNRYVEGETTQVILSNFRIVRDENTAWEKYVRTELLHQTHDIHKQ